jgi:AcrR family transcriptional regulator
VSPALRKPSAERREEIVRAALEIIGRRGMTALSTQALADAVGVTTGALFRHFPSVDSILEAAVSWAEERIASTFPAADRPGVERLRALAKARVALFVREPGLAWLLRSEQAFLVLPPAAVRRLRGLVRRSRAFIRAAVEQAVAEGDLRDDVPPDVLRVTFTATVHALASPPGLQGRAVSAPAPGPVLAGLFHLLAPADGQPRRR